MIIDFMFRGWGSVLKCVRSATEVTPLPDQPGFRFLVVQHPLRLAVSVLKSVGSAKAGWFVPSFALGFSLDFALTSGSVTTGSYCHGWPI